MRTLSEAFAPGTPTLPEGLRTLVVSPERELEPGMTIRATFTFRNQGGAPATGVRVRFTIPDGLVYLVGSGDVDGTVLDDERGTSPLISRAGAPLGDVAPGEERRIDIAYSVAGAIENGTTIELQAAVASFELAPVGSNVVRLVARSRPALENALTMASIEARSAAAPGNEATVTVRVHNAGESSAHDVVVVAPIPPHTSYVSGSARLNGRDFDRDASGQAFDRSYAPVVAPVLPANASAILAYRVRIEAPLSDGTVVNVAASVASQESPAFALAPAALVVRSAPDFADDRTSLSLDPSQDARPGQRVALVLAVWNGGTACAETVTAGVELPDGMSVVRGSAKIDGRAIPPRRNNASSFDLGRIDSESGAELRLEAVVVTPMPDASSLPVAVTLDWQPAGASSSRRLERTITVRSEPALGARRNGLWTSTGQTVHPGDSIEAWVDLANDGSAAAGDVVLHVRAGDGIEDVRAFDKATRLPLEIDALDMGTLEPNAARRISLRARVRSPMPDRSEVRLGATVHCRELGETSLGDVRWTVDSHPRFDPQTSRIERAGDEVVRPNQIADIDVMLVNAGTDVAHDVRLRLYVSPEARLESVDGAAREKSSLVFGEIAPGGNARARLGVRLLRGLAKEFPVTVDAVLTARAMLPLQLERLTIATAAEPDFSIATLSSEPVDVVDVGETIDWTLHVRNGGDGPARRVRIAVERPSALIYVPNSTTVNDVPVRDSGAVPAFAVDGIALNDVDPGVEATIRWRDVVNNGVAAGEALVATAECRYDGDRADTVASNALKVRSTPVFANAIAGLPFGLDGVIGPASPQHARSLTEHRFLELPPATPVAAANGADLVLEAAILVPGAGGGEVHEGSMVETIAARTGFALWLSPQRAEHARRFLAQAKFDGLVAHLFAIRVLLPDAIGSAHCTALSAVRDALREELDRLFIKLRLPSYALAERDVETPSLRASIKRLAYEASLATGAPADPPHDAETFRGFFDPTDFDEASERLDAAPLATAAPWSLLARLLPDRDDAAARYRALLIRRMDEAASLDPADFLERLQHRADPELDRALEDVRALLSTQ
jgi:uncharacterized repeat protein (TIGR01451 family)